MPSDAEFTEADHRNLLSTYESLWEKHLELKDEYSASRGRGYEICLHPSWELC